MGDSMRDELREAMRLADVLDDLVRTTFDQLVEHLGPDQEREAWLDDRFDFMLSVFLDIRSL